MNHNVPGLSKNYIHRVGRTARAGRTGMAVTLVTQFDIHRVQSIEEHISKLLFYTRVYKLVLILVHLISNRLLTYTNERIFQK